MRRKLFANLYHLFLILIALTVSLSGWLYTAQPAAAQTDLPRIIILDVDPGLDVTVQGRNFPANTRFTVFMADAIDGETGGISIASMTTPADGEFVRTFNIPARFSDLERITIRFRSQQTGRAFFAVFKNEDTGARPVQCTQFYTIQSGDTLGEIAQRFNTTVSRLVTLNNIENPNLIFPGTRICVSTQSVILPPTGVNPAIEVIDVDAGEDITVRGTGFPAGMQLNVLFGLAGTTAANGIQTRTFTAPQDGELTGTFAIPESLADESRLVIRFESTTTAFFTFTSFDNTPGKRSVIPVEEIDLPSTPAAQGSRNLTLGRRLTFAVGNGGIFLPNSQYEGRVNISRFDPNAVIGAENLIFTQRLMQVQIISPTGGSVDEVRGLIYVFFNLTADTLDEFTVSDLDIYRFNQSRSAWERCNIEITIDQGGDVDRLACVNGGLGLYAIAAQP